jgi:WS/DGAT/MGAT family acyltransferase
MTVPAEMARSVRAALRGPEAVGRRAASVGRAVLEIGRVAPRAPWNVPISAHRRFEPARVPLDLVKAVKDAAGVTVNDVVLAACAGALRAFLEEREEPVDGLVLRALVPVSVRAEDERLALGNRVSAMVADLPVGEPDPAARLRMVADHIAGQKDEKVAVGGDTILRITEYAPPNLLGLMSRVAVRTRPVNLGITNVPGPDRPLYCMGARLLEAFPYVGIIDNQALMIGVLSYDGQLGFGITGDREVLPDLATLARAVEAAFTELAGAVGVTVARR